MGKARKIRCNYKKCGYITIVLLAIMFLLPFVTQSQLWLCYAETKISASDRAAWDNFGESVAISGNTIVIGSYQDDDKGTESGSVYVYRYDGMVWREEAKLTASDGAAYDWFGYSVAISGDTIIIGACKDDNNRGANAGSAYVYRYDGTAWREEGKLTASDGATEDRFGSSVAIDGNITVIGALWDDDKGHDSGSAYTYRYNGTMWQEEAKLTASDGLAIDNFGAAVAIDEDTIVIGGPSRARAAYVYRYNGNSWQEEAKLTASDGFFLGQSESSVAINGGIIIVGAPESYNSSGISTGAAYVYRYSGSAWREEAKLTASDGEVGDYYGFSVATNGDTIVVGVREGNNYIGVNTGAAYIYRNDGILWREVNRLSAGDGAGGDRFGCSVAIRDDTVVVGAWGDDYGKRSNAGSAYIYNLDISVSPTNLNFGEVLPGFTSLKTLTISNPVEKNLQTGTLTITGVNANQFVIQTDNCSNQTIAPSESCTIDVKFSPVSLNWQKAVLNITFNGPDNPIQIVSLRGKGAKVIVTSPNGGESLTSGSLHVITWQTGASVGPVAITKLRYTVDGIYWKPITNLTGDPGSYSWTIPSDVSSKCKVKVKLKDASGNTVGIDNSDSFFTIQPGP